MAKETVQAVRQAELTAVGLEKEAVINGEAIILKAQEDAKTLIAAKTKEARLKADEDKKQAQLEGAELLKSADLRAEQEILLLKEMGKNKERAAIDLVLSEVL